MELRAVDGRRVDLGSELELAEALSDISFATGGSSARGEFSLLFGLRADQAMPADAASRLGQEAGWFAELHGSTLRPATNDLLRRLTALVARPAVESGGLARLAATWDCAVEAFLDGDGGAPAGDLRAWFDSYAGRGHGCVDPDAMPEPFLGSLETQPQAVFLALNPGRAFDFQRRDGLFADRVRQLGSYTRWAATWPYIDGDWEAAGQRPNRHHQSRLRFLRRWLEEENLPASAMVAFELYPWHSTRVTAAMKPDPSLIRRYVWDPISELGKPLVFAFGAPWFPMLREHMGFEQIACLGRDGKDYGSGVPSRAVLVLEGPNGITVVAEKRAGAAGPPSADETRRLRAAIDDVLTGR